MEIGIIGAGVIGLSTALRVQTQLPQANVTLLADKFRDSTTSDGAAGIFRPGTSFCVGDVGTTKKVIVDSFDEYSNLLRQYPSSLTGVTQVSGYLLSSISPEIVRNALIEDVVPTYRPLTQEELYICPGTWKYGSYFTTILTECRKLLPFYEQRFIEAGGKTMLTKVEQLNELAPYSFDVVFNCMGFGAKTLFSDPKLVPIRGQVLKVKAPWLKNFFYADYDTYIIPGQESVTLGGCRNFDSYDLTASVHDSAAILERCTALVPKLRTATPFKTWVGLRPHRDPVRIEATVVTIGTKKTKLIHNYGHGGYGVTTAPGSAILAVELFKDVHRSKL